MRGELNCTNEDKQNGIHRNTVRRIANQNQAESPCDKIGANVRDI